MDDIYIFEKAVSLLEADENVALVTVVSTEGSTPGKVGYKMLVSHAGSKTMGTVGGGLVEAEMIAQAGGMLCQSSKRVFRFDLDQGPDDEKGICGGSIELLVEAFDRGALSLFRDLVAAVRRGEAGVLLSIIAPEETPRKVLLTGVQESNRLLDGGLAPEVVSAVNQCITAGSVAERVSAKGIDTFIETLARAPTVVIFGAGHLSYHIARGAKGVHFRVIVCDDRPEYANSERFPDADDVVVADFTQTLERVCIDTHSYVVIVTRGHKSDEVVLERVLQTDARYIGMIGSKRKTLTILDKLRQKGFSERLLGRVYSPIGLGIGAVTPEEIALSIVCELVKIRRMGRMACVGHMTLVGPGGEL